MPPDVSAVVVGLCAHGLAIARSLHCRGISVIGLEADSSLPGIRTNHADVRFVADINGPGLIEALVSIAQSSTSEDPAVLILTNDRMVETVARNIGRLDGLYRISWSGCAAGILSLLRKSAIVDQCSRADLFHPKNMVIEDADTFQFALSKLKLPIIVKPDRPISSYKTIVVRGEQDLASTWSTISQSLPAVAQEYIEGDESCIYFAALYLQKGSVTARFEGRKLRSRPMGHTTVAIAETNESTHSLALQFFDGLELSGPVSLELKMDGNGNYWVIEPTVGRTDFWVDLCVADGVNVLEVEVREQTGGATLMQPQSNKVMWINIERDPGALLWMLFNYPRLFARRRIRLTFFEVGDQRPFFTWFGMYVANLPNRLINRLVRVGRSLREQLRDISARA